MIHREEYTFDCLDDRPPPYNPEFLDRVLRSDDNFTENGDDERRGDEEKITTTEARHDGNSNDQETHPSLSNDDVDVTLSNSSPNSRSYDGREEQEQEQQATSASPDNDDDYQTPLTADLFPDLLGNDMIPPLSEEEQYYNIYGFLPPKDGTNWTGNRRTTRARSSILLQKSHSFRSVVAERVGKTVQQLDHNYPIRETTKKAALRSMKYAKRQQSMLLERTRRTGANHDRTHRAVVGRGSNNINDNINSNGNDNTVNRGRDLQQEGRRRQRRQSTPVIYEGSLV